MLSALGVATAQEATPKPSDLTFGVIRWDRWYPGSEYAAMLDRPRWQYRLPFFAEHDAEGHLVMRPDHPDVVDAELVYSQAGGIDYWIFGYHFPRSPRGYVIPHAKPFSGVRETYLKLADAHGIRFALEVIYPASPAGWAEMTQEIAALTAHPRYEVVQDGRPLLFFHVPDEMRWIAPLGDAASAKLKVMELREGIKRVTGRNPYIVAMNFWPNRAAAFIRSVGMDAFTSYGNPLGRGPDGRPRQFSFERCAQASRWFWQTALETATEFIPPLSFGWDYRPMLGNKVVGEARSPAGDYCETGTANDYRQLVVDALNLIVTHPQAVPSRTMIAYAWNELSEGGWLVPTQSEGTRRLDALSASLGSKPLPPSVELRRPLRINVVCIPHGQSDVDSLSSDCRAVYDRSGPEWPCPSGMRVWRDTLRPATPEEVVHGDDRPRHVRRCVRSPR